MNHCCPTAVAVTAPPEDRLETQQSLESLRRAGFEPYVCRRPGVWQNWIETLRELLTAHPHAQTLMVCQDDALYAADLREYLHETHWPASDCGMASLYTPSPYERFPRDGNWCRIISTDAIFLIGAVCCLFPRHVAEWMVASDLARTWRGVARPHGRIEPEEHKKAVDTFIGHALGELGLTAMYHRPSLVQHIGSVSTHGEGKLGGSRVAASFAGEDVPAVDAATGNPGGEPISVVIPACGSPDLTMQCLQHLARFAEVPFELVYVDNDSPPDVLPQVLDEAQRLQIPTQALRNEENLGFTAAVNQGIRLSRGRHVLVLNNDCFVGPGCLRSLLRAINIMPRTASAGPLTDDDGHQSLAKPNGKRWRMTGFGAPIQKLADLSFSGRHVSVIASVLAKPMLTCETMLAFFCTLLHKDAIAEVGLLDDAPEYEAGLGADDDWCRRALEAGWTHRLCYDAFASHIHSETFRRLGIDRQALQAVAMHKYRSEAT